MKRYCLHPGMVPSLNDGDKHFIGYGQLLRLYGVAAEDCGLYREQSRTHMGKECLYPSKSGMYKTKNR